MQHFIKWGKLFKSEEKMRKISVLGTKKHRSAGYAMVTNRLRAPFGVYIF